MIGTDFEGFLRVEGKYIPVPDGLNIGSKYGTHIQLEGGTMHRDNIMVEICPEPCVLPEEMSSRVSSLIDQAEAHMSGALGVQAEIAMVPTVKFGAEELGGEAAAELGCDRDYLASRGDVIG